MAKHPARCPKCKGRLEYESAVDGQIVCPGCKAVLAAPGKGRPADPLLGQTLGEFEILELIGRGGMGAVYKGRQPSLDRLVAIKVLPQKFADDASFLDRFHREARAAAAISHPNIIEVYGVGVDKGHEFIAMEFVDGDSLAGQLKREGRLAPDRALDIMKDVASALAEAHAKGIVHRDIKPANILLTARGRVKVADFGLAKRAGVDVSVTHTGASLGTPLYMAPEIARGELDNPSSDLYALGATFYQAIAGRPPFDGATPAELIVKHVNNPVPPLQQLAPDAPPGLCRVIHRLLYKNPAERYETADKLVEALNKVEARLVGGASAARIPGPVGKAPVPCASDVTRTLPGQPPAPVPHRRAVGGVSSRRVFLFGGIAAAILFVASIFVLVPGPSSQSAIRNPKSPIPEARTPDPAAEQREGHAALCLEYAQTCAGRSDWAKAKEYLDDLAGKYAATRFAAERKADIAALRTQVEGALKPTPTRKEQPTPEPKGAPPVPQAPVGGVKVALRRAFDAKEVRLAALSPDGKFLAWTQGRGGYNVAPIGEPEKAQWVRVRRNMIFSLAWGNSRPPMVACGDPYGVAVWNNWGHFVAAFLPKGQATTIAAVAVSPDATRLASGSSDHSVWLWDLKARNPVWKRQDVRCYYALAFTPDGTVLACGGMDLKVHLLDAVTGKTIQELSGQEGHIQSLAISPDGAMLAAGGNDNRVLIWDLAARTLRHTLTGHTESTNRVSFSRDSALVASGGSTDKTVRLWDARTGRLLHTITDHKARVTCVAFSPTEDLLITADESGRICLWDVTVAAAAALPQPEAAEEWTTLPNGWRVGKPVNLGPPVNSAGADCCPCVSGDERTLVFTSKRPGGRGEWSLWACTRRSPAEPWGKPFDPGPAVNAGGGEGGPCLSEDGLTLVFHSKRAGGQGDDDLWMCTRRTQEDPWGQAVNLGPSVNSAAADSTPTLSADGLVLVFRSTRPGGQGGQDLWMSTRRTRDDPWSHPANLGPAVNSRGNDESPSLSGDVLTLFFDSDRPGGQGGSDLWMATRHGREEPFGQPVNLGAGASSASNDSCPCNSFDGRTLYFTSSRPGGSGERDLWQAPLLPPDAAQPAPPDDEARWGPWEDLFDGKTLKGWERQRGQKFDQGKAQVDGDRILLFGGRPAASIGWTGAFPDADYEVEVEAMRTGRQNCFCAIGFPIGQGGATFVAGDMDGTAVGLDGVDDKDALKNETGRRKTFAANRWYRVRLQVAQGRVRAWIDGEQVVDLVTAGHTFTYRDPNFAFRVMAWAADAAVRAIRLRRLKAKAPSPDADARWGPWEELFDGKALGGWKVFDRTKFARCGVVRLAAERIWLDAGAPTAIAWTREFPRVGYEIQLEAMREEGDLDFASIIFPIGTQECKLCVPGTLERVVGLECVDGKSPALNGTAKQVAFENGRWYRIRLRVTDAAVSAWIDDVSAVELPVVGHEFAPLPMYRRLGPLTIHSWLSRGVLRSIRLRRLKPEGTDAPKAGAWKVYTEWPFDAKEATRRQEETAQALGVPVERDLDLGNGVKMTMVLIPAGEFVMGHPEKPTRGELGRLYGGEDEKYSYQRERPQHRVRLTTPFWLGRTEVTQAQWQAVVGTNPSRFKAPENPVDNVSWDDCQTFLTRLNEKVARKGFRLPTEAEWEHACRAGAATQFHFGDAIEPLSDHAWWKENSGERTNPVGRKKANRWGLHDMIGNVWEWCGDGYGEYLPADQTDPTGMVGVEQYVMRGGDYGSTLRYCRSAARGFRPRTGKLAYFGFRVARALNAPTGVEAPTPGTK